MSDDPRDDQNEDEVDDQPMDGDDEATDEPVETDDAEESPAPAGHRHTHGRTAEEAEEEFELLGHERRGPLGRLYHGETSIDFYGRRWLGLGLSALLLLLSIGSLVVRGLNLSLDFRGGVVWEIPSQTLTEEQARAILEDNGIDGTSAKIQELLSNNGQTRTLKVQVSADSVGGGGDGSTDASTTTTEVATTTTEAATTTAAPDTTAAAGATGDSTAGTTADSGADTTADSTADTTPDTAITPTSIDAGQNASATDLLRIHIQRAFAEETGLDVNQITTSSVSSLWGKTITEKAIRALLVFLILVALFIAWRLEWRMAMGAIVAMLHDMLLSVGVYSLLGFEVTPATVVAFLTILGFSLYDTIVVFDKVKENQQRYTAAKMPYADIINVSMNQVLMRSLNTSLAAALPVLSLLILGAGVMGAVTLSEFALALLVGLITGSYSSIFVAAPLVAMAKEREPKFRSLRGRHSTGVELERLVLGGSPSGRREAAKRRSVATQSVAPVAMTPQELLTHTPRPRKKKRRS